MKIPTGMSRMANEKILTLKEIRRLRPQIMALARQYRARKVSVFGSCVRGEMQADSDIDFLVDFEEEYSLLDHAGLLVGLEDLLGCKVDVVSRRALRPFLRDTVISEAQEL
jgi:predicted nucleotidyltransferase